jgi:alkylhydroperoxidase family enzyme
MAGRRGGAPDDRRTDMAHVDPRDRSELPEFEEYFAYLDGHAGYVPNAFLTMARLPELFRGYQAFSAALGALNGVPVELKTLMSHLASSAYGCRFCEAHTAHTGVKRGVADERIEKVWEFESSDLFTPAEKAALRLGRDMGMVPNQVTRQHFDDLREWFTEEQIVEMVAAVSLFGFWNRWNDTMATDLEVPIVKVADALLGGRGWEPGKHKVMEPAAD